MSSHQTDTAETIENTLKILFETVIKSYPLLMSSICFKNPLHLSIFKLFYGIIDLHNTSTLLKDEDLIIFFPW